MNWNVDKTFIQNFHVQVEMSGGIKNILPKDIMYWKLLTFSGLKLITLIFKYPKNLQKVREILDRVVFYPKLSLSADFASQMCVRGPRLTMIGDQCTCISSRRPWGRRGGRCSKWSCWPSTPSGRAPWSPPSDPTPPPSSSSRCPASPSWCGFSTASTAACRHSHRLEL